MKVTSIEKVELVGTEDGLWYEIRYPNGTWSSSTIDAVQSEKAYQEYINSSKMEILSPTKISYKGVDYTRYADYAWHYYNGGIVNDGAEDLEKAYNEVSK